MKQILLLLFPVLLFSQNSYQDGYKAGYKAGFCYGKIGCVAPVAPYAPADLYNTYQSGYNNGFVAGKKKQEENQQPPTQLNGGAYGQLQPTQTINTQNLNNALVQSIYNADWEGYYERRRLKKEKKLEDQYLQKKAAAEYYNNFQYILNSELSDLSKNKINENYFILTITNLKKENDKIYKKHNSSRYYYLVIELENKINKLRQNITNDFKP